MVQVEDLFHTANSKWGLSEEEVRTCMRAEGFKKWNPEQWEEYLEKLRWFWLRKHVAEYYNGELPKTPDQKKNELQLLERTLTIVEHPNGWYYTGSEEAMAAHWELEDIRRKENIQRARRRLYYGRIKEV